MRSTKKAIKQAKKFLEILGIVGNLSIILGVISFVSKEGQRRNSEIYQAWQVINTSYSQSGNGGRREAMEFLNSKPRRSPFFCQGGKGKVYLVSKFQMHT